MNAPDLGRGLTILLLAAASYTIAHSVRLLMRRDPRREWIAGTAFGFLAFVASRIALAGAAWLIKVAVSGDAPAVSRLIALVGLSSTPLLLAFVNATPFFGPGVLRILYGIALIRLATLASQALGMEWWSSLGWWTTAWLLEIGLGALLTRAAKNAKGLGWTGLLGSMPPRPADLLTTMPGMHDAQWGPGTAPP